MTCPPEFNVISCGFERVSDSKTGYWQVWPSDNRSCTADYLGTAKVYAVCARTELVGNLKIVSSKFQNWNDAVCPSGSGVTGCGIQFNMGTHHSGDHAQVFPNNDGKSCHCQNLANDGTCYAICSDSVLPTESSVYETSGEGNMDVSCEGEAVVFGCGITLNNVGGTPSFYVDGYNKCHSNAGGNHILTALCGTFGNNTNDDIKTVSSE